MIRSLLTAALLVVLGACGQAQEYPHLATIHGRITVADSIDASGDFSGFGLAIVVSDSTGRPDTLYSAVSGADGYFRSQIFVPSQGRYPMQISRYGTLLANAVVVLGLEDSVKITAEFPDIERTALIESPENEAIRVYDRVTRNYNRVVQFLNRGALSADSIPDELQKWSDLYWDMQNSHPKTLAARLGTLESLKILEGWNDSLLVERVEGLQADEDLRRTAAVMGMGAMARLKGVDATLAYMQQQRDSYSDHGNRRQMDMARIALMSDSLRIDDAVKALDAFDRDYKESVARGWSNVARYDLENLSLGKPMPPFTLKLEGGAVLPSDSLKGTPYLLEIASLRDPIYQQQYAQMQGYFYVYAQNGLQFLTIPVEDNVVVIDGFFEERQQLWPLAEAGTWREDNLMQRLNITSLPVRFLVDSEGNILRKYTGSLGTLVADMRKLLTPEESQ